VTSAENPRADLLAPALTATGSTSAQVPVDGTTIAEAERLLADRRWGFWYTSYHADLKMAVFALIRERHAAACSRSHHHEC
jgi:hypothetical protein